MQPKKLYKLRMLETRGVPSRSYQIEIWDEAYVVAVNLWTTNGSARYVARLTAEYLSTDRWVLEDCNIEADFTDSESIYTAIKKAMVSL